MAKKLCPQEIASALSEGGKVAAALQFHETRQAQLDLSQLVARAFNENCFAAAEAGTGVGKSFAYLVPALLFAMKNREKVVISTATITLQRQLFEKDIPLVTNALGGGYKTVLMKGRGNYLCRRRLEEALREPMLEGGEAQELKRITLWAESSKTGEKEELSFLSDEAIWAVICSESESCMGLKCSWRERCFVLALRKEALDAHIVVVNHHLLFADLAVRYQGAGYDGAVVLPPFNRLIIDEAHTIEKAATSFFSKGFSSSGVLHLLGRLYFKRRRKKGGLLVRLSSFLPGISGGAEAQALDNAVTFLQKIKSCTEDLQDAALEHCGPEGVLRLSPYSGGQSLESALFPPFRALAKNILAFNQAVRKMTESFDEEALSNTAIGGAVWETKAILRRLETVGEICASFVEYRARQNEILWIEKRRSRGLLPAAAFTCTPLEMAKILEAGLFAPNKTVVCVSATLTVNDDFTFWAQRCGINAGEDTPDDTPGAASGAAKKRAILYGCFPSPFPYSSAVLLASPYDAPQPGEEGWQDFINQSVGSLAAIAGGSALVLFTSYQSLQSAWLAATPQLEPLGILCLKQGDDDRTKLLNDFLADESSVLFATDSFWEGVDAPGDTLRLVILCRLPFQSPGDPVFEARCEALEKRGGSPFMELSLPQAVMKFKQGFGRLMRRSSDSGVVAVLDSRLLKKSYGQLFLQSLPETRTCFMNFSDLLREAENFLY